MKTDLRTRSCCWRHADRFHAIVLLAVTIIGMPLLAVAQGLPSPAGHWGAIVLPDVGERTEHSLLLIGFTEFGKDRDPAGSYLFDRYNDWDATLGINLYAYTSTRSLWTGRSINDRRRQPPTAAQWSRRRHFFVGKMDDRLTKAFQNNVIHGGRQDLPPIPRTTRDTPDNIGTGLVRWTPLVVGLSEQYFFRFATTEVTETGEAVRVPTPFYVGAGLQLSNVNHEAFVDVGASLWNLTDLGREISDFVAPVPVLGGAVKVLRTGARAAHLNVATGAVARLGVLRRAHYFEDLTSDYGLLQGVARISAEIPLGWRTRFPVAIEVALSAHSGFFPKAACLDSNGSCTLSTGARPPRDEVGMIERLGSIRMTLGDFRFETYNDLISGKDKGPSFGASVSWDVERLMARRRPKRGGQ